MKAFGESENCKWCADGSLTSSYCPYCGRSSGRISDPVLSKDVVSPPQKRIELPENGSFIVKFNHLSGGVVNIECDISSASNIAFAGKNIEEKKVSVQSSKTIGGLFEFVALDSSSQPSGYIIFILDNASRDPNRIWKKNNKKEIRLSLSGRVVVTSEKWVAGSPCIVFPSGVNCQNFYVYNNSSVKRTFCFGSPVGYLVESVSNPDVNSVEVGEFASIPMKITDLKTLPPSQNASKWLEEELDVKICKLPSARPKNLKTLTLAIDLGDNNVSIRARWPKGNPVFGKSKGFVEKIGGDRFSCAMVMDVNERDFFFGDEALNIIAKTPMRDEAILNQQNLAAVLNLRSDIMDGIERYVKYNGKWTNEYLLRRLFSVLMDKIQAWAKGLFAERRTEIPAGFRMNEFFDAPEFAITYPPMSSEEECEAYKAIISRALLASFSDEEHPSIEQITFISEPQAAINYFASNKKNLLAEIPDGEQIAIIDIGENSSKVTVASVDRNKGVPKLIISAIDKLMIKEGTRELSGNLIDSLIAGVLGSNTKRLLLNPLSGEFLNLWETMWGRAEYVRRDDKLRYSKRIKDKFAADGAVTLKVPSGASFTKMALNYKKYSEVIIDPVMDQAISALRESLKAKGVDPDRISACVLLGGVNICGALRDKFSNLTSEKFKYGRLNDSLEPSERINAVIDGAVLGKDLFLKTSFATLKIKDESGSIDETLIREHEVFLPVTIMRSSPFSENGGASLSLIAESELFETPETLAVAICRQDFADSSEFSSEAVFEISLTQDACICRMFSGSRKEIGWNVKLS